MVSFITFGYRRKRLCRLCSGEVLTNLQSFSTKACHAIQSSPGLGPGRIQRFDSGDQPVDSVTGLNRYNLSGAGLGLSLARTGSYRVGLVWAHALGSNPGRSLQGTNRDGKASHNRLLLAVSVDL